MWYINRELCSDIVKDIGEGGTAVSDATNACGLRLVKLDLYQVTY